MSTYANPAFDKLVAIDECHCGLISALVSSRKPKKLLELGFGSGTSCRDILNALHSNSTPFHFTVVDNWLDFGGVPPEEVKRDIYSQINFISSPEKDFVENSNEKFEFILSDADHFRTQEWFKYVYENMLSSEGILIYHDVTNSKVFPNLLQIYNETIRNNYHHMLFNYNSKEEERCDRGLLVIFKH